MEAVTITESEILEALRESAGNPNLGPVDAFTRGELRSAMGWGLNRTTAQIFALRKKGAVEVVSVKREGVDGKHYTVSGYRFVKQKRAAR